MYHQFLKEIRSFDFTEIPFKENEKHFLSKFSLPSI